jgi:hypothetical protein
MASYNKKIEEGCVELPRFEEQKLNSDDYLHIEAEAAAARGFIKGFAGGALLTIAFRMFITSTAVSVIKPFCGGIIGVAGIVLVDRSFDEWRETVIDTVRLIRIHRKERRKN